MFIQLRTIVVEQGNSDQVVANFSKESPVEQMEGFLDKTVMVDKRGKEDEEVVVMIRWRSKEDWKNWEKSDVHIQGHREKRGQQPPAYVIRSSVKMYEVEQVKQGKVNS
ncbi:antibiotic biosynthesis monooxygenase [Paenibacillus selenitireducens]|uniref:Antibiotic biosynthesis monooxygenase n=1 Tax=Paenibacillus selenitireducens TaxID=1324314 RepID=A0A1T2XN39_9BACL|nr:antibiotic biosynthesis monooxygenase [Paenibacillus selenitireducens]OPA81289.1 antibiotic biosynthesis monooxygenase [Paenibacillus selenitireducens]